MGYYILKVLISSVLIVAISETAKRSSLLGAILASIPLTSFLAILWMYFETRDVHAITGLSKSIFWLVLPSLSFFLVLPCLLKHGTRFGYAMAISTSVMIGCYFGMTAVLKWFHISL
jgi:hypothetical protein